MLDVSDKILHQMGLLLYKKIINYTPIGDPTLWKYSAPKNYHPGALKKSWGIDLKQFEVNIYNPQPYTYRIEYGWSTQSPYGMVRRSISEVPQLLNAVTRAYKI